MAPERSNRRRRATRIRLLLRTKLRSAAVGISKGRRHEERTHERFAILAAAICAEMTFAAGNAVAQLAPNQTNGFGNRGLVTFTYLQNFDCLDEPTMDLDFNGIEAQSDPNEMQTPICQVVTEPSQDPTCRSLEHTVHIYALVPM